MPDEFKRARSPEGAERSEGREPKQVRFDAVRDAVQSMRERLNAVLGEYGRGLDEAPTAAGRAVREAIGPREYQKARTYERLRRAKKNQTGEKDVLDRLDPDIRNDLQRAQRLYDAARQRLRTTAVTPSPWNEVGGERGSVAGPFLSAPSRTTQDRLRIMWLSRGSNSPVQQMHITCASP
jgi:hypothetical protein